MAEQTRAAGQSRIGSAEEQKKSITPTFVLEALRRWWKVTLPVGLLVAAAIGAGLYLTFDPVYEAKALLWISDQKPVLVKNTSGYDKNYAKNQLGLIRSTVVLTPVLSHPEVSDLLAGKQDPLSALQSKVMVSRAFGTEHYYIRVRSTDPEEAAVIVNAVADSYQSHVGTQEARRTKDMIELLNHESDQAEVEIEGLRDNFRELYKEHLGRDPFAANPAMESSEFSLVLNLQNQLATVDQEQVLLDFQIKAEVQALADVRKQLESQEPVEVSQEVLEKLVEQQDAVVQLKAAIDEGQDTIASLRDDLVRITDAAADPEAAKNFPLYLSIQGQIKQGEQRLEELREGLKELKAQLLLRAKENHLAAVAEFQQNILNQHQQKIQELKKRLKELGVRDEALQHQFKLASEKLGEIRGHTFDLIQKQQELDLANTAAQAIASKAFWLRIEQRAPDRFRLVEKASVPIIPVEKVPWKKIGVFGGGALVLPFVLALLWELRIGRITDPKQIEDQGRLPVLAEIASFPVAATKRKSNSRRAARQLRLFEESVQSLRTYLALSRPIEELQMLAVTSSVSREGKTTVAAQLAISIARATGKPTLLIDGDLRAPDLHDIFEIENEPGLAELLNGQATLDEVVQEWDENCHVLPAGRLEMNPHKLLGNGALSKALKEMRAKFAHIVIDTPPVLSAGESLIMAQAADATILCAKREVSREDQFKKTRNRLQSAGANLAGCVFNDVPIRRYSYRYGYYDYE